MIQFHEESKTFHLYNDQISYIFKILKNNQLGQLYYGKRIHDRDNFDHLTRRYGSGFTLQCGDSKGNNYKGCSC